MDLHLVSIGAHEDLRLGDLLSALLFMVVMEALSRMMSAIADNRLLSGFLVGLRNHEEMILSHVLFADYTLIFCEANCEQFRNLWCLFLCFEAMSGLKINLSKSETALVGDVGDVEGLASILGVEWLHCC
jgi:hypothetical protein